MERIYLEKHEKIALLKKEAKKRKAGPNQKKGVNKSPQRRRRRAAKKEVRNGLKALRRPWRPKKQRAKKRSKRNQRAQQGQKSRKKKLSFVQTLLSECKQLELHKMNDTDLNCNAQLRIGTIKPLTHF